MGFWIGLIKVTVVLAVVGLIAVVVLAAASYLPSLHLPLATRGNGRGAF